MNTTELRAGLYFTLPEENLEKTRKLGNNYMVDNPYWNRNKYYTVVEFEGKWYMVNVSTTYRVEDRFKKHTINLLKRIKETQEESYYKSGRELDSCLIKLNDKSLSLFNFEFDLRDKDIVNKEDVKLYKWGDVELEFLCSGQHLRFKNKNTKPDLMFVQYEEIDKLAEKQNFPRTNEYAYKETIKCLKEMDVDNKELIEEVEKYFKLLKNVEDQLEKAKEDFKWIDPTNGEINRYKANEFLLGENNAN